MPLSIPVVSLSSPYPFCCVDGSHSPGDGNLECFQFGAIMSKVAVNLHVPVFLWANVYISLMETLRSGIAGARGRGMVNFIRNCQRPFPRVILSLYIPTDNVCKLRLLHILANT